MLVKELIEKLDTELDYIEITSDGESESFSPSALSENYGEIKEYLDKEVKRISFKTHDEYDESILDSRTMNSDAQIFDGLLDLKVKNTNINTYKEYCSWDDSAGFRYKTVLNIEVEYKSK